jgi:hypothetical protein
MRLNILFSDICGQLIEGSKQVLVPPSNSVPVTEEDDMKFVRFSANGMDFEGRFKDSQLWVGRPDGTFVALTDRDRVIKSNPAYSL